VAILAVLLKILSFFLSISLIILVLLQRGRGGGLAGAFGGMGGQSAFGTKAGDIFTRITVGVAILWVISLGLTGVTARASQNAKSKNYLGAGAATTDEAGTKGAAGDSTNPFAPITPDTLTPPKSDEKPADVGSETTKPASGSSVPPEATPPSGDTTATPAKEPAAETPQTPPAAEAKSAEETK
jgi:preprotein translocase subunit SecG